MNEKLYKIHADAVLEFNRVQSAQYYDRTESLKDRRFYIIAGSQWEGNLGAQFQNKPRFEMNKVQLAVVRIMSEYRNNQIGITFGSASGDDDLSDFVNGIYRADEQESNAECCYINAFEEALGGGMGAWEWRSEYEDESDINNDKQCLRVEYIPDADSCVFFDLDSVRQDKSDSKRCWVLYTTTREAYEGRWGKYPVSPVNKQVDQSQFDWGNGNKIYIARYYVKEFVETPYIYMKNAFGEDVKILEEEFQSNIDMYAERGYEFVKRRMIKDVRVHKYIMSGNCILEDLGYVPGKSIPVIPVYGKWWIVDGVERFSGHVRTSKDAQRLKNMQISYIASIASIGSVRKPVLSPEQVLGHEVLWAEDNIKNNPYLLINPSVDAEGNNIPAQINSYIEPPNLPEAMVSLLKITDQDMSDMLGKQESGEELLSNVSGKAVELVQNKLDMQAYIYVSNMAIARKRSAEVWLEMAKETYVETGRQMKFLAKDDKPSYTTLDDSMSDEKIDIQIEISASSSTKKSSIVRTLSNMTAVAADDETRTLLTYMILENIEGEGLGDLRKFFRKKLLLLGALTPTEEEEAEMKQLAAAQPNDPDKAFLEASAVNEQAKAQKAQADAALAQVKAAEIAQKISANQQIPLDNS